MVQALSGWEAIEHNQGGCRCGLAAVFEGAGRGSESVRAGGLQMWQKQAHGFFCAASQRETLFESVPLMWDF